MTEFSYLWTTGGAGDGANPYSRAHWAKVAKILAASRGFEGVVQSYLSKLVGTVPGANTARFGSGAAVVDGKPYDSDASVDVNIPSAVGAGNTRIDRIVLRASWAAQTVRITRIAGTDAVSPTAPAITQTSETTYDILLYQALVNTSGVVTLTDERVWAEIAADKITNSMIADNAVWAAQIKDGEVTTAKIADSSITSAKLSQPKPYSCRAKSTAVQSIPDSTNTLVDLGGEDFDSDAMHDLVTNNSRLVCKRAGRYFIFTKLVTDIYYSAFVLMNLLKNGSVLYYVGPQLIKSLDELIIQSSDYLELAVNDYLQLQIYQISGVAVNISNVQFSLVWDG